MNNKITIVFVGGFLLPPNYQCYPSSFSSSSTVSSASSSISFEIISVYPSPIGSINDRIYEIFYELKGGGVKYNQEHCQFHHHNLINNNYSRKGKFPQWDENNPIYVIGHSYG